MLQLIMRAIVNISLPKSLEKEVEKQVKEGKFASRSEFFRTAVKTYFNIQSGEISWDILAAPFKTYAREKKLTPARVLQVIEEDRHARSPKSRN